MLRAIAAAKRKNDRIDANKIADVSGATSLCPKCHMASTAIPRSTTRIVHVTANLVVEAIGGQIKNRISGLLMLETGVSYNKQRLHEVGLLHRSLMATNEEIHDCVRPLLRLSREHHRCVRRSLDYALVEFAGTRSTF